MWIYQQSTGKVFKDTVTSDPIATGYSGINGSKNNPADQAIKGKGPIPRGDWMLSGEYDSPQTGPYTIILTPLAGTAIFNRGGFRIHGDSVKNPGSASHGCIILPRVIREKMYSSGDHTLRVVI